MPAIVAAALAQTAVAAPVVAGTTAGLGAAALPAAATLAPSVAQTAGLELAKQQAIQEGMRQAGQAGIQQAAQTTAQQAAQTATQKAVETAAQQGLDPSKLDYLRSSTASLNPTAPSQFLPPKAPAGDLMSQINNMNPANFADDIAAASQGGTGYSGYSQVFGPQPPAPYGGATPPVSTAPAAPLAPAGGGGPPLAFKEAAGLGNAPPELTQNFLPKAPFNDPGTLARAASDKGISDLTMRPASESMFKPTFETQFPLAEKSALEKGIETGLKYVKDNPISSGLSLMTLGQYMNKPKEEDKDKYKNKVDMSEFQPSLPSVGAFKPSYEYQKYAAEGGLMGYAVGGPVEQMSALNSVGANTQYPMAGLATPLYSNPAIQRPEAVNVISPSAEPAVGMYSGEQKFAEGGISDEMAREYGLKNRKQRAAKSLTKDYEEMEAERNREATAFANSVNINSETNPKIIRRSRTQELSSPYSAAIEEHNRLAKRTKTPKFELAKTSLGDIDTYMDVPVEAARGGIMGNLGGYSDGGRLLRGPGDGVSDSIPAVIGKRQPARLADGEFVIPARIVSELGNGSTEAGARKLYAMMERIQSARKKSIGKKKVAVNSRADKHLPA